MRQILTSAAADISPPAPLKYWSAPLIAFRTAQLDRSKKSQATPPSTESYRALRSAAATGWDPYLSSTNVDYGRHNGQSGLAKIHCTAASFPALNDVQSGSIRRSGNTASVSESG